jgi:hypothetical protein
MTFEKSNFGSTKEARIEKLNAETQPHTESCFWAGICLRTCAAHIGKENMLIRPQRPPGDALGDHALPAL